MKDIKDALNQFNIITLQMNESIRDEDYEKLSEQLDLRNNLIAAIQNMNYEDNDFKNICNELKLVDKDNKLTEALLEKKKSLLNKMNNISTTKAANNVYTKINDMNSYFFNKKT